MPSIVPGTGERASVMELPTVNVEPTLNKDCKSHAKLYKTKMKSVPLISLKERNMFLCLTALTLTDVLRIFCLQLL